MKVSLKFTYELKPALLIGDYVRMAVYNTPVFNHPYGHGFVREVRGYGSSIMSTIQMGGVNGGWLLCDMLMRFLILHTFLGDQLMVDKTKIKRSVSVTPYAPKIKRIKN